jgi:hypothetical protein
MLANVAGTAGAGRGAGLGVVEFACCGGNPLGFGFGGDADWEWACDLVFEEREVLLFLLFWRFGSGSLAEGGRYSCMLNVSAAVGGGSKMVVNGCDGICDGGGGGCV